MNWEYVIFFLIKARLFPNYIWVRISKLGSDRFCVCDNFIVANQLDSVSWIYIHCKMGKQDRAKTTLSLQLLETPCETLGSWGYFEITSECLCPGWAGSWNGGSELLLDFPAISLVFNWDFCRKALGAGFRKNIWYLYMLEPVDKKDCYAFYVSMYSVKYLSSPSNNQPENIYN